MCGCEASKIEAVVHYCDVFATK